MTESKYKCTDHHLDLVCRGCVMAHIAVKEKLLEFVKQIITDWECNPNNAEFLLKEIGELND